MGLRIGLVIHPHWDVERVEELRGLVERLRGAGHTVTPRLTFESGDAYRFARGVACARYELVIAAGGDGTVNEVVNGLVRSRWQPRLAVVPLGTANDFAAGLEIPSNLADAVAVAIEGRATVVDVARVNRRCFINVSTGGFGAEATEAASAETKRALGTWAYLVTGVRKFVELRPSRARFRVDGRELFAGEFLFFAVGNARQTGGGKVVTPRAQFGDGKLDVVIVPALPRMDFIALLPDLRAGTHLNSPDVLYLQTPAVEVDALQDLVVNADGEPMRGRRFRYRLLRRPLSVMVP